MLLPARTIAATVLVASVLGCATLTAPRTPFDRGVMHLRSGTFEEAYRTLEDPKLNREAEVADLMRTNPALLDAGLLTFSPDALRASVARYGPDLAISVETARLERFKLWADPARYERAAAAVQREAQARSLQQATKAMEEAQVAKLAPEDQARYWATKRRQQREAAGWTTGIIVSAQVANESYITPATGERLGSAAGQSAYLDSTNWGDYSATAQLGAGLAGALVGSLVDQPTQILFRITYFVRTADDEIKRYEQFSANGTHVPAGVCVAVRDPGELEVVNQKDCTTSAR